MLVGRAARGVVVLALALGRTGAAVDRVYVASAAGVDVWSSDGRPVAHVSDFPSYAIAVAPDGRVYVGNGGVDCLASGITTSGVFRIDGAGTAQPFSPIPAEDLAFDPLGNLFAADAQGIHRLLGDGTPVRVSANPTGQLALESPGTAVTTTGAIFAGVFGIGTDRIDLATDIRTPISADGGEDIQVPADRSIRISGQGGIARVGAGGALEFTYSERAVFSFAVASDGTVYYGNPIDYGGWAWQRGLYVLAAGSGTAARLLDLDINSIHLIEECLQPGDLGNSLRAARPTPGEFHLRWANDAAADVYNLYRDAVKGGGFAALFGSAPDGSAGLTLPLPADPALLLRVAGAGCGGEGPK